MAYPTKTIDEEIISEFKNEQNTFLFNQEKSQVFAGSYKKLLHANMLKNSHNPPSNKFWNEAKKVQTFKLKAKALTHHLNSTIEYF